VALGIGPKSLPLSLYPCVLRVRGRSATLLSDPLPKSPLSRRSAFALNGPRPLIGRCGETAAVGTHRWASEVGGLETGLAADGAEGADAQLPTAHGDDHCPGRRAGGAQLGVGAALVDQFQAVAAEDLDDVLRTGTQALLSVSCSTWAPRPAGRARRTEHIAIQRQWLTPLMSQPQSWSAALARTGHPWARGVAAVVTDFIASYGSCSIERAQQLKVTMVGDRPPIWLKFRRADPDAGG
jgi:hypothetical protein